ncbi:hypothetical protein [Catellatospora citrea]|uniref:PE-PGRS family protein n=1 Tax=Catellatospora citrea TaxID=53366 RepID=A0A8J3KFA5_9ACTN|nr:hypothetical protein [Catellatospora citrea]RKE10489.1 hypothetical protein C8E86_5392 [Catellatospora citrea]GIF99001.1 hypothetical protein Cci01nite_40950 [Catellatospora citrea]
MTEPNSGKSRGGSKRGKQPSKSEALLAEVVAAGGTLEVSRTDGVNYGALMAAANLYKVPNGKRLVWAEPHGRHATRPQIRLEDQPEWMNATLDPLPIPPSPTTTHPAVARLAKGEEHFHRLATGRQPAALRLLQALAAAAAKRGYEVSTGAADAFWRRRTANQQWIHLTITISGHHMYVGVDDGRPRGYLPEAELRRLDRAKGPVLLRVVNGQEHRASHWWLDVTDERAGDQLAHVLQELELRAEVEEQRHQKRQERERHERRQREEALAHAKEQYFYDRRAELLVDQVDRWHLAQRIDAYLDALERVVDEVEDPQSLRDWIAWARQYRLDIDPLESGIAVPVEHEPELEKLAKYLPASLNLYAW